MPLNITIPDAYAYAVNLEAVRLYTRRGAPLGVVANAKRLGGGRAERAPSEGEYIGKGADWRLPASGVTADLMPGCVIVDSAGIAYTILGCDLPGMMGGWWRCSCIALTVLGHTITWHFPTKQTDAFGSPIVDLLATWPTMVCAIGEVACEEVLFQGIVQGFRRTYAVWLAADVALSFGAYGVDDLGRILTVKAVGNRNRIDELLRVDCVVEP
jgi:hypothetical protein